MAMSSMGSGGSSKTPNADFLKAMIEHHQAALTMSNAYLALKASTRLASATDLAKGIIKAQTAEIADMRAMLTELKSSDLK